MSDKKNWGSTVLGWFVVQNDGQSPATVGGTDTPAVDDTAALTATFAKDIPAAQGGRVDFDAVFDAAIF